MNADDASRISQIALMAAMADGQITPTSSASSPRSRPASGCPRRPSPSISPQPPVKASACSQPRSRMPTHGAAAYEVAPRGVQRGRDAQRLASRHSSARCTVRSAWVPAATHEFEDQLRALSTAPLAGTPPDVSGSTDAALDERHPQAGDADRGAGAAPGPPRQPGHPAPAAAARVRGGPAVRPAARRQPGEGPAGTFGLGAAAQMVEGMVRKVLGRRGRRRPRRAPRRCDRGRGRGRGDLRRHLRAGPRRESSTTRRDGSSPPRTCAASSAASRTRPSRCSRKVQGQIQSLAQQVRLPDVLAQIRSGKF
jgi:hypothetical protein